MLPNGVTHISLALSPWQVVLHAGQVKMLRVVFTIPYDRQANDFGNCPTEWL